MTVSKTPAQYFQDCRTIFSTDNWQGVNGGDQHEHADDMLDDTVLQMYHYCDPDAVLDMLDNLKRGPLTTIVRNRLSLIESEENLAIYETDIIEIDTEELQAAIDSGEILEVSEHELQEKLGTVVH